MTNFAMFTDVGNAAVKTIADEFIGRGFLDAEMLFDCVIGDVENLSGCQAFDEASDTAVREAVFVYCNASFVNGKSKVDAVKVN